MEWKEGGENDRITEYNGCTGICCRGISWNPTSFYINPGLSFVAVSLLFTKKAGPIVSELVYHFGFCCCCGEKLQNKCMKYG